MFLGEQGGGLAFFSSEGIGLYRVWGIGFRVQG